MSIINQQSITGHVFDPRTKLILALFYAVLIVASNRLAGLASEWLLLMLVVVLLKKGKEYVHWLQLVLTMSLFFGAITWWSVDLETGAMAALKLLALTSVFFVFFSTTMPEDLGNSLVKAGMPYPVAFVMGTALQFVPIISRKAKNVLDAQRSRGIPVEPGWSALRHYPAFLIPLLIQSFQLAEELAEAMEARGFGRPERTFLQHYQLEIRDWAAILTGGVLLIGFFLW